MKNFIGIVFVLLAFLACKGDKEIAPENQKDWSTQESSIKNYTDFVHGKTYLPVYSHIYHRYEHRTFDLTVTVSIRNISITDSVYILKADYYNTNGDNIRQYIQKPIYLKPMETVEIIIDEDDKVGGSGANFVFDWAVKEGVNQPLFEAVMISTYGVFSTRGIQMLE
jgi:hypothetical protein